MLIEPFYNSSNGNIIAHTADARDQRTNTPIQAQACLTDIRGKLKA